MDRGVEVCCIERSSEEEEEGTQDAGDALLDEGDDGAVRGEEEVICLVEGEGLVVRCRRGGNRS